MSTTATMDARIRMRCLKRRLADRVYKTVLDDSISTVGTSKTGPGGQRGNGSASSAAGSHPQADSSDKTLPGPAKHQP